MQQVPGAELGDETLLGSAFEYFGRDAEAEPVYRTCLERDPNNSEVREALARNLLFQSRPDEAWNLLAHVLTERKVQSSGLLLIVAESYQGWGMHGAALDILEAAVEAFPELRKDRDYKRLYRTASKYKNTNKPIKSKSLVTPTTSSGRLRSISSRVPMAIAASVLLAGLGIFALASTKIASSRTIYVVNGLSVPYEVILNGQHTTVRPKTYRSMEVAEGDIEVSVKGEGITVPTQSCRITTNFFARVFTDPVFILNPDRTALCLREETEYSVGGNTSAANLMKFYWGDLLLTIDDADFRFQEFPSTLSLPSQSPVKRSRVTHLADLPPRTVAGVLASEWNEDRLKDWVRRLAESDADDPITTGLVAAALEPAEALQILGKLRSMRPLRIEAHRAYQQLSEIVEPDHDW